MKTKLKSSKTLSQTTKFSQSIYINIERVKYNFCLQERVRHLLGPEFLRLGLRSRKNDSVPTLRQRRQIAQFACLYKLPDCVKRAKRLYVKWESQTVPDKINPFVNLHV